MIMAAEVEMGEQLEMVADADMAEEEEGVFSRVHNDILLNILGRLPAVSFASAACVDKRWNQNCNRILCRPKFGSALSLNPNLHDAVDEVLGEAFSKPLRPDFVVAYIGSNFSLSETHQLITEKLGPRIPVITNKAKGLIGKDVETNKLREVIWGSTGGASEQNESNSDRGVVLSVGFVPGLKVDIIPLLRPNHENCMIWRFFATQDPHLALFDHFLTEIIDYTFPISGSIIPSCIMMFGDRRVDMNQILAKLDYAMPDSTAIVGDASASFMCTCVDETENYSRSSLFSFAAAALVFVRDQNKPEGIGETEFHVTVSPGMIPFGPHLRTISAFEKPTLRTWVSALMVGFEGVICDCNTVWLDLKSELGNLDMYIGVTQRRYHSLLSQPPTPMTSLTFHEIKRGELDFILVDGVGIKAGDVFFFYHEDTENALNSITHASRNLRTLQKDSSETRREVFGGFIFASKNRGVSFFKRPGVDSKPFAKNFPGVPVAGMFGDAEIGRGNMLGVKGNQKLLNPSCCVHAYSSVYLAMSYVPPPEPQLMLDE